MEIAVRRVVFLIGIYLFISLKISAQIQLFPNTSNHLISESQIYINEDGVRYSDVLNIKFNKPIIKFAPNQKEIEIDDILSPQIKKYLKIIKNRFGNFYLLKLYPSAKWGDTLTVNKRSGKNIHIPDWSQVLKIKFKKAVPIDSIIYRLRKFNEVQYAEEPFSATLTTKPNDEFYLDKYNWAFQVIESEKAWDITKGDSTITIGILDKFGISKSCDLHEDLINKVDGHFNKFGDHGICVAGIAGAETNNKIGIASLGWNLRLRFYDITYGVSEILRAIDDGVDVLNFSWVRRVDLEQTREAIKTALAKGIVCVGAAGNDDYKIPDTLYPAAYNFGELGQVIAVSATKMHEEELFYDGLNFSPGNNPLIDPTSSFIDVAAPGWNIPMLCDSDMMGCNMGCGTSLATPFVSALAGLILSVDRTLTPVDVYEIITKTTDKIGQYEYDENGWNRYLGFGRINAYRALKSIKEPTTVHTTNAAIENNFLLEQNYPNPFNASTTIKYSIPSSTVILSRAKNLKDFSSQTSTNNGAPQKDNSYVTLKVYDILGQEVVSLVNHYQKPGNYKVEFNATNLSSGIYYYKLTNNNFTEAKKMILLK